MPSVEPYAEVMPFDDQSTYQVRADWGIAGLRRLAPADVVVVVDALRFTTTVTDRVHSGESVDVAGSFDISINGAPVALAGVETGATVLAGSLRNASAVADAIVALQNQRQARTSVAVIACGERIHRQTDEIRFAVEDQLAAGAIVSALSDRGLDHTSPDAAVMGEAFRGLSRAITHLFLASPSGRELIERDRRDDVVNAATLDAVPSVAVLRDGRFVRLEL